MKKYIIIVLALTMVLTGCAANDSQLVEEEEKNITISTVGDSKDIIERSEFLSDKVVEQYGIDDTTTIILNDTALVGVKLAYDEEIDEEVKELINNIVLDSDTLINNVKISDDKDIFHSIDDIVFNILQGKEYESLLNDINNLNNRI